MESLFRMVSRSLSVASDLLWVYYESCDFHSWDFSEETLVTVIICFNDFFGVSSSKSIEESVAKLRHLLGELSKHISVFSSLIGDGYVFIPFRDFPLPMSISSKFLFDVPLVINFEFNFVLICLNEAKRSGFTFFKGFSLICSLNSPNSDCN